MEEAKNNRLAKFFNSQRELIEAAETPFAKLAVFVLPILAPLVPAFMTGTHLYKLFLEIFSNLSWAVSFLMALIIGVVFELLGYVGAINFIKSMFTWIQTKLDENLLPMGMNFLAYLFYLIAMWAINVQLSNYFGVASIVTTIVGVLSFVTVPTSLLAATHLNDIANQERETKLQEAFERKQKEEKASEREYKLERLKIKSGFQNTSGTTNGIPKDFQNSLGSSTKTGRPSIHEDRVFAYMDEHFDLEAKKVPSFTEVAKELNLPESTASRLRNKWIGIKQREIDSGSN